jgi:hypothetical protein
MSIFEELLSSVFSWINSIPEHSTGLEFVFVKDGFSALALL